MLEAVWIQHEGVACRGVDWGRWSLFQLQQMAECLGGVRLASICQLLVLDRRAWSGGLPDLFLWRPLPLGGSNQSHGEESLEPRENSLRGDCMLVEVKSERDRLSTQQLSWLLTLKTFIRVEVLKVKELPNVPTHR